MRTRVLLVAATALAGAGCISGRPATVPMPVLRFDGVPAAAAVPSAGSRCLIVLLPGIRDVPSDFERHGFPALARERGVACDLEAADAHVGYFRDRQLVTRLHDDVIAPARARGYGQVWLAGVSLGGLGSLLYAQARPGDVAGIVLIAPYLGDEALVRDIRAAGGVRAWAPGPAPGDDELRAGLRDLWGFLKGYGAADASRPPTWLVYGTRDRFAPAMQLLRDVLPPGRVITDDGRHDWDTWRRLWIDFLDTRSLPGQG